MTYIAQYYISNKKKSHFLGFSTNEKFAPKFTLFNVKALWDLNVNPYFQLMQKQGI